jgi:hypothetical protein
MPSWLLRGDRARRRNREQPGYFITEQKAMAALRQAARRLGGTALQRPQALYYGATGVSPHQQRLLAPAIFHGGVARPRPMSTSGRSGAGAPSGTTEVYMHILCEFINSNLLLKSNN